MGDEGGGANANVGPGDDFFSDGITGQKNSV